MGTTSPIICTLRELAVKLTPLETFAKIFIRINRRAGTAVTKT